jgi:hypothetical protein
LTWCFGGSTPCIGNGVGTSVSKGIVVAPLDIALSKSLWVGSEEPFELSDPRSPGWSRTSSRDSAAGYERHKCRPTPGSLKLPAAIPPVLLPAILRSEC